MKNIKVAAFVGLVAVAGLAPPFVAPAVAGCTVNEAYFDNVKINEGPDERVWTQAADGYPDPDNVVAEAEPGDKWNAQLFVCLPDKDGPAGDWHPYGEIKVVVPGAPTAPVMAGWHQMPNLEPRLANGQYLKASAGYQKLPSDTSRLGCFQFIPQLHSQQPTNPHGTNPLVVGPYFKVYTTATNTC